MPALYDLAPTIFAVTVVSIVLSTFFTACRITVRFRHRNMQVDDWFALVGQMFWLACLGLVIAVCFNGVGARDDHITLDMIADISKYYVIFQNVYIWSNAPIKISVCLSIHRVLKHYVWISWTLYFMIFVIVSSSIGINIWLLTFCYPIEYQWNKTISGTCRPLKALVPVAMAWSYINIIVDWSVALLPVFVLWRANMPWQHKLTVAGVLSLGIFASCATIIRLVHLEYLTSMKNYFYGIGLITLWTVVEVTLAIIAVSLIALRPLLRRFFGSSKADRNARAAAHRAHLGTAQRDMRFFRMHGWAMPLGLDSYVESPSAQPINGSATRTDTLEGMTPTDTAVEGQGDLHTKK